MLFVDEIHRMPRPVEEVLYPALEDFSLDVVLGKGPTARSIRLELPRFTLVAPPRVRGGSRCRCANGSGSRPRLDYYGAEDLTQIVGRSAGILGVETDEEGAAEIARRSRGTPRIANRLLRRVRDFAEVRHDGAITARYRRAGLEVFEVDEEGLDRLDHAILRAIVERVRRGTRRVVHAGGRRRRGARHGGGRRRALPAAARIPAAHPARAGGHRARLPPSGHGGARARCRCSRAVPAGRLGVSRLPGALGTLEPEGTSHDRSPKVLRRQSCCCCSCWCGLVVLWLMIRSAAADGAPAQQALQRSVEVGDEIVTTAGIFGTIVDDRRGRGHRDRRDRARHEDPDAPRGHRATRRGRRRVRGRRSTTTRMSADEGEPARRGRRQRRGPDPARERRSEPARRVGAPIPHGAAGRAGDARSRPVTLERRPGQPGALALHRLRRPRDGGDGLHRARVPPRQPRGASISFQVLHRLGYSEREATLASVAGYLHDVGNALARDAHGQTRRGARLPGAARHGADGADLMPIMAAIANHEETEGMAVSPVSAAVILADKSDVHRSRVRKPATIDFDIHDRVNYAVEQSFLRVDSDARTVSLELTIDTQISQVMEYFEIFLGRMQMCRHAAECLDARFRWSSTAQSWREANPRPLGLASSRSGPGRGLVDLGVRGGRLQPTLLGLDLEGGVSVILSAPEGTTPTTSWTGAREHPQPRRRLRRRGARHRAVRHHDRGADPGLRTARSRSARRICSASRTEGSELRLRTPTCSHRPRRWRSSTSHPRWPRSASWPATTQLDCFQTQAAGRRSQDGDHRGAQGRTVRFGLGNAEFDPFVRCGEPVPDGGTRLDGGRRTA